MAATPILAGDGTTTFYVDFGAQAGSAGAPYLASSFCVGTAGSAVPTKTLQVGGSDGTNLRAIAMDTSGRVKLAAGALVVGVFTTDQTTHGTTDLVAADIIKVAGSAISQGHGTAATAIRVELPTDGTGVVGLIAGTTVVGKFGIDQTTPGTTNFVAANITQVAGSAISQGHGTAATAIRVELPTDGTGVVGLIAGTALVGKVSTDQTTHGTSDLVAADITKVAGSAISQGHGTAATAIRVELPTDGTGIVGLAAGTNAIGAVTSRDSYACALSITRPANTTAYTANDILGGALTFTSMGPSGKEIMITSVSIEADIAAIPSGQTTFNLYLYNVTPPSAVADNGAFDLPSGDRASFLGKISISALVDEGSTLYIEANAVNKQVTLSGTSLFGYLVTVGAFTPNANSEVYKVTLHAVAV